MKNLGKALLAGVAAGAAASLAMKVVDDLWQRHYGEPSYETEFTGRIAGRHATAAHFAIGTALGAGYGAAVEMMPEAAIAGGIPFFVGEAVLGNEVIGPMLGLFRPPQDYPANKHWNSVLTHIVYGAVAELVRRNVRQRL
jgi:putative membrane protein